VNSEPNPEPKSESNPAPGDWQTQSVEGLKRLTVRDVPALELIFLDGLAAHLIGPDAPVPPYTMEHGTAIASMLLRSVADAPNRDIGPAPEGGVPAAEPARVAVVAGARSLGARGGIGVHQLVTRFLAASVGELERNQGEPEEQVRSLFYYGLLAVASGPENKTNAETAEGLEAAFQSWNDRIGDGFVPSWRVAMADGA
jgi:hypothetical protein